MTEIKYTGSDGFATVLTLDNGRFVKFAVDVSGGDEAFFHTADADKLDAGTLIAIISDLASEKAAM